MCHALDFNFIKRDWHIIRFCSSSHLLMYVSFHKDDFWSGCTQLTGKDTLSSSETASTSEYAPVDTLCRVFKSELSFWRLPCILLHSLILKIRIFEFLWTLCLWDHLLLALSSSVIVFLVYAWLVLLLQQEICELDFEVLGAEVDLSIVLSWLSCSNSLLLWWCIVVHLRWSCSV